MLGIANDLGTVQEGKIADLVIVGGDPLKDVKALRHIMWTIKDGVCKTPEQWMN